MLLGLSSQAAPDAALDELLDAAMRRGFGAVELREGDAHGVTPEDAAASIAEVARRGAAAGVMISGYRTTRFGRDLALARLSYSLGASILLDARGHMAGRIDRARQMLAAGADVVLVLRGDSVVEDGALATSAGLALGWDADPRVASSGALAESLLRHFPGRLRHIRLLGGGGPEAAMQEGRGVGELMRHLALAGYGGTLVLAPSTARYRVAWRNWLGRRGGWGCGSKTAAPPLHLTASAIEGDNR